MKRSYKAPFRKFVKKQTRPLQLFIEDEVEKIAIDPDIGKLKRGDLTGFRVHSFSYGGQKFLIAYCIVGNALMFYRIGSHENFYRELKKYLKEVGSS